MTLNQIKLMVMITVESEIFIHPEMMEDIAHLQRENMIETDDFATHGRRVPFKITERGAVFIEHIRRTPLPIQGWRMP